MKIIPQKVTCTPLFACLLLFGIFFTFSCASVCVADDSLSILGTSLYDPKIQSRAVTAENPSGAPGAGGKERNGRKGAPCIWVLEKDKTYTLADIQGPGVIRHMWMTFFEPLPHRLRNLILRIYWDNQSVPSVEAPLGDFFGAMHGRLVPFESLFLTTAEGRSYNSYFPMPFRSQAKITVTNETNEQLQMLYYQIDYTTGDAISPQTPYFHAQFRRTPQTKIKEDYVILDGVSGQGRYLGASIAVVDLLHETGTWWGEGEVKIYLDGDTTHPTICGTGTEDYALTGWSFTGFHNLESGTLSVEKPLTSFYRFHARDPIYFHKEIKVTLQQLGNLPKTDPSWVNQTFSKFQALGLFEWLPGWFVYERSSDVASVAYWYQTLPTRPSISFPSKEIRSGRLDLQTVSGSITPMPR